MRYNLKIIRLDSGDLVLNILDKKESKYLVGLPLDFSKPLMGTDIANFFFKDKNYKEGFEFEDSSSANLSENEKLLEEFIIDFLKSLNNKFTPSQDVVAKTSE